MKGIPDEVVKINGINILGNEWKQSKSIGTWFFHLSQLQGIKVSHNMGFLQCFPLQQKFSL